MSATVCSRSPRLRAISSCGFWKIRTRSGGPKPSLTLRSVRGRPSYRPSKSRPGPQASTDTDRFSIRARKRAGIPAIARSTICSNSSRLTTTPTPTAYATGSGPPRSRYWWPLFAARNANQHVAWGGSPGIGYVSAVGGARLANVKGQKSVEVDVNYGRDVARRLPPSPSSSFGQKRHSAQCNRSPVGVSPIILLSKGGLRREVPVSL